MDLTNLFPTLTENAHNLFTAIKTGIFVSTVFNFSLQRWNWHCNPPHRLCFLCWWCLFCLFCTPVQDPPPAKAEGHKLWCGYRSYDRRLCLCFHPLHLKLRNPSQVLQPGKQCFGRLVCWVPNLSLKCEKETQIWTVLARDSQKQSAPGEQPSFDRPVVCIKTENNVPSQKFRRHPKKNDSLQLVSLNWYGQELVGIDKSEPKCLVGFTGSSKEEMARDQISSWHTWQTCFNEGHRENQVWENDKIHWPNPDFSHLFQSSVELKVPLSWTCVFDAKHAPFPTLSSASYFRGLSPQHEAQRRMLTFKCGRSGSSLGVTTLVTSWRDEHVANEWWIFFHDTGENTEV